MKNLLIVILLSFTPFIFSQTGWFNQPPASYHLLSVNFTSENYGMAVGYDDIKIKTTNGGTTWLGGGVPSTIHWDDISMISQTTGMIFGGDGTWGRIAKTTNFGQTWQIVWSHPDWGAYPVTAGQFLDANNVIALMYDVIPPYYAKQLKSTNAGASWQITNLGEFIPRDINFNRDQSRKIGILVGDNGIIKRTTNLGATWQSINNPDPNLNNLNSVYLVNGSIGFICGDNSTILKTTNGGLNWFMLDPGSVSTNFQGIFFPSSSIGYIVGNNGIIRKTSNGGVDWGSQSSGYSGSLYDVFFINDNIGWIVGHQGVILKTIDGGGPISFDKIKAESLEEIHFTLYNNYPNPFNPSTKISWQSPVSSLQSLKIYDVLGNEVATLVNEFRNAGSYEVDFDASKLSSGVYFYKLQAGDFVQTKKMLLMK